jgi:lipopolysaccharide/colanic/teichoic acid biosynthesis glycosyltransferase
MANRQSAALVTARMAQLQNSCRPFGAESLFHRAAKRAFDLAVATLGLILLSPTFLLVSAAIKIDSRGSIFRRHARYDCE